MWAQNQLVFFEGESEADIKAEFIRLSAKHKNTFDPYQITAHIFAKLREPGLRAMQAADVWTKDLEVQEAIRAIIVGNDDDELLQSLWEIARDRSEMARDRLKAMDQIAEITKRKYSAMKIETDNAKFVQLPIIQFVERNDANGSTDTVEPAAT